MATSDLVGHPPFLRVAGHPLRWRVMTELAHGDLRVRELVALVGESQNLISYHLRVLRDAGLVSASRSSFDARDSYHHLDLDRCAEALAGTADALHPALRLGPEPPALSPRQDGPTPSVLFVCTGNSARSPLAEAMVRLRAGERVRVSSAGTVPKDRIHPHVVRVLREQYGVDIAAQAPRPLDLVSSEGFDHVVTLCDRAREQVPGSAGQRLVHWSVRDPAAASDDGRRGSYRRFVSTAAEVDSRVRHLLPTLLCDTQKEHSS